MKKILLFAFLTLLAACAQTGRKNAAPAGEQIRVAGVLEKPEVTTYQYGTHAISGKLLDGNPQNFNSETRFALKSERVKLDDFVGKRVIITGVKVPGYPVDMGPEFLDVSAIEADQRVDINSPKN